MKSFAVVAIVIAGLVSACSSEQQQGARSQNDPQVSLAQADALTAPDVSPTAPPTARHVPAPTPLTGPCCQP
jgi:hypothetical protein